MIVSYEDKEVKFIYIITMLHLIIKIVLEKNIKIIINAYKMFHKSALLQGQFLMMLSSSFFIAITPSISGL